MKAMIEYTSITSMKYQGHKGLVLRVDVREHRHDEGFVTVSFVLSHHGRIINRWSIDRPADTLPFYGPITVPIEWPEKPYRDGRIHPIRGHTYKMQARISWTGETTMIE